MNENMCKINDLVPYVNADDATKTNEYFFDDMSGETWKAFKLSVAAEGVIEPLIITEGTNRIVSGHQRWKACCELGLDEVPVISEGVKLQKAVDGEYVDDEDKILLCLIETNLKQRGNGNPNPVKMGRCIKELERLYGIKNGNNQYGRVPNNSEGSPLTQADLAARMGMSVDTLTNYKKIAEMPDEVGAAIMSGRITQTTALKYLKNLSAENQISVVTNLNSELKYSGPEIEKVVEEMKRIASQELHSDAIESSSEELPGEEVFPGADETGRAGDENIDLSAVTNPETGELDNTESVTGTLEDETNAPDTGSDTITISREENEHIHNELVRLTEENCRLREENVKMTAEIIDLKSEIIDLKSKLESYEYVSDETAGVIEENKPVEDDPSVGADEYLEENKVRATAPISDREASIIREFNAYHRQANKETRKKFARFLGGYKVSELSGNSLKAARMMITELLANQNEKVV